jgi:hypothetical protein
VERLQRESSNNTQHHSIGSGANSKVKIYRILSALVVALAAGTAFSEDQNLTGTELLISGPVEKVDAALGTVTIFGREISTNKASQLAPGQIVDVYGSLKSDGSMADTEIDPTPQYGSGGDPVFIKGVVTDVNALLGQAQFGGTTVDYTAQLASAEFTSPSVGEVLAVDGTQPLVKGVILASEIGPDVVPRVASVQSRGFASLSTRGGARSSQGIQGGGVGSQGIQGGGVGSQGIQGGGVGSQGIQGGGVGSQGIQGGGVGSQGIQGGGVGSQGIQGGGSNAN